MSDENNVLVNEEGELLVHEDNLLQTAEMILKHKRSYNIEKNISPLKQILPLIK